MTTDEYINKVRAKIEEISPFSSPTSFIAAEGDGEFANVNPINSYIEDSLGQSVEEALTIVPLHLLSEDSASTTLQITKDNGVGNAELPTDFLRLVSVKVESWERKVTELISVTNPLYLLQQNPYTRGGYSKPIAAIVNGEGKKRIELYSVSDEDECALLYIPKLEADQVKSDISEYIVLLCAINVLTIFNQPTDKLTEKFNSLINQHTL